MEHTTILSPLRVLAVGETMSAGEAERYHLPQIEALVEGGVDLLGALTLTYAEEAIGIVRAAGRSGVPVAVFFTVETDASLPSGQSLRHAIEQVEAETEAGPAPDDVEARVLLEAAGGAARAARA